ncbi:hypothetical protein KFZ70_13220 [Tamlana fucoidanivorans]|uniref:Uncharacterized protein n=1 Tax=Allotamlana fucoidanivorans TaxID=2583814 RepID=A0A5C4SQX7_9FLAO|nr:hypothetical protein [Tamlana fucoidanivorans]TNJ46390.1 hypothetical protein FGF67_01845 [Tamlana fucoidanivorans]
MKTKIILLSFSLFLVTGFAFAQKKDKGPKSIISEKVTIKKYHNKEELERMSKGELVSLYTERNEVLTSTLPYIAFATKPGITMTTLGIPETNDNRKALDDQFDNTEGYLENTLEFHQQYLPYSDTRNLIAAILFYEEIMKSLHQYNEFR